MTKEEFQEKVNSGKFSTVTVLGRQGVGKSSLIDGLDFRMIKGFSEKLLVELMRNKVKIVVIDECSTDHFHLNAQWLSERSILDKFTVIYLCQKDSDLTVNMSHKGDFISPLLNVKITNKNQQLETLEQRISDLEKLLLPTEFEFKAYVNKDNPNHFLLNTEPNYWVEITDGMKVTWVQTVSKKMKLRKANENELLQIIKLLA